VIQSTIAKPRKRQYKTTLLSAISHHHRHQDEPRVTALHSRPLLDQGLSSQASVLPSKRIFLRIPPRSSLHHGEVHPILAVFSSIDEVALTFSSFIRLYFAMIDLLSCYTFTPYHYAIVVNRIGQ
jgi:hypothetical protein